jgi:hypothetical protein
MKQYNSLNFFPDKNFAQTYTSLSPTNCMTGCHCSYMFQLNTTASSGAKNVQDVYSVLCRLSITNCKMFVQISAIHTYRIIKTVLKS